MMDFQVTPDKTRTIELENGNKLNMTRTDPYGAIILSLEHGQLPDNLKGGQYTSWEQAERAAKAYQDSRKKVTEAAKKAK